MTFKDTCYFHPQFLKEIAGVKYYWKLERCYYVGDFRKEDIEKFLEDFKEGVFDINDLIEQLSNDQVVEMSNVTADGCRCHLTKGINFDSVLEETIKLGT